VDMEFMTCHQPNEYMAQVPHPWWVYRPADLELLSGLFWNYCSHLHVCNGILFPSSRMDNYVLFQEIL
jgi:hypothetical protein